MNYNLLPLLRWGRAQVFIAWFVITLIIPYDLVVDNYPKDKSTVEYVVPINDLILYIANCTELQVVRHISILLM